MTEDEVRDRAREILDMEGRPGAVSGVGQLTTFNQLGFPGVSDKPDGWYLPSNRADVAMVLETKASGVELGKAQADELLKNVRIVGTHYGRVVGVLYNGDETRVFKGAEEYAGPGAGSLKNIEYYTALFDEDHIDKEHIYDLTKRINDCLHTKFGIKNLYHRMIFTACALVARRYNALMVEGMDYSEFHNAILNCLNKELYRDRQQNQKLGLLTEVFSEIRMNLNVDSEDAKEQQDVKDLIAQFIGWVSEISDCLNSDACCGSGGFLVKAMANMIAEAGGMQTAKAREIRAHQLYGIEFDREIYALACANMLIHKDGKSNLEQLDARTETAGSWIEGLGITKVLMNPPYERKYGCMDIVENVLDHVPCAFILPDKKLEKTSRAQMGRILRHHRLRKIVKMPEDLFFGVGITTSIFVFESGVPQNDEEIFACWMKEDGLQTVKNKGRHDVRGRWHDIEAHWVEVVKKQSGDDTCQWIKPSEHLSYQVPQKPFQIYEEDFRKSAMDYVLFQKGIDINELKTKMSEEALYGRPDGGDEA